MKVEKPNWTRRQRGDLGSKPWQMFLDATRPLFLPGLVAGAMLVFIVWSKVKLGVTPDINALAAVIIGVVTICVTLAGIIMYRAEKRRERDIQAAIAANE